MVEPSPSEPPSSFTAAPLKDARTRIIDALMELAGERRWEDISISEIAARAGVSLADFRDHFPSKGAVLAALSRKIDKTVLERGRDDLVGEPAKERLFDVLMRRLDALAPYKNGLESALDWARRDPIAAAALNKNLVNSMRFMLEAAGVEAEGAVGVLKLQGLAFAWGRVLDVWFRDEDPGLAKTMAALDRELTRGSRIVARAEDVDRLASPLRSMAAAFFDRRRNARHSARHRPRESWRNEDEDPQAEVF
ncbi:MAG TPA: helix-turn-helix domain-containing protein [Beijerinckiaceae bacterium]|nr:helix-turn-helix domain-containing protein [Beijerinckiaceae bacterium]